MHISARLAECERVAAFGLTANTLCKARLFSLNAPLGSGGAMASLLKSVGIGDKKPYVYAPPATCRAASAAPRPARGIGDGAPRRCSAAHSTSNLCAFRNFYRGAVADPLHRHKAGKAEEIDPIGHLSLTSASPPPPRAAQPHPCTVTDAFLEENEFHGFHIPQRTRMIVNMDGQDIVRNLHRPCRRVSHST